MASASSLRFRLLMDLVKQLIFAVDGAASWFSSPRRIPRGVDLPDAGRAVAIPCQGRSLEGYFVTPAGPAKAAVLMFHGIGDRTRYWRAAQLRLARSGIASLIFHYSGYGESEGTTTPENLEANARAAYAWLVEYIPAPTFLLGFSLGSGLAAQVAGSLHPQPRGLILSQSFTTLREAAKRMARPASVLAHLLPDIWNTRANVAPRTIPLLIVHSSGDALFPVTMAEELYAAALDGPAPAELKIFAGYRHNAPYLLVPEDYWAAIVAFIQRNITLE